jgi:nitrous oxidase accessory protein NosD
MVVFVLLLMALGARPVSKDGVLTVKPGDSLQQVSQRLAKDASIREVVLEAGTYPGGWTIPPLEKGEAEEHPLLIRTADGASVLFDGAKPLPKSKAVPGRPGVFSARFDTADRREPPQVWEPERRVRYLLAADVDAVQRFEAAYFVSGRTMFLHPSGGRSPGSGTVLTGVQDFGLAVQRRYVTVRGLRFRNFTARGKWSAAVQMRADHVTVERCDVTNASFGFTLLSDDDALVESTARDVGGGVYLAGRRGRVERSRFFKTRDDFAVPTYSQDDTAIQGYYPSESGVVRGNLAIGFGMGMLIKSEVTPWVVEENTFVSADRQYGFIATRWHPESVFRRNVVAGYSIPATFGSARTGPGAANNCYGAAEPGSVTGDPRFVDPASGDYRLSPDSPCRAAAGEGAAPGAGELARSPERIALRAAPESGKPAAAAVPEREARPDGTPRTWHVSPTGRDGAPGRADAPLRSIQEAVDHAAPGDTILLQPGIYAEPVRFHRGGTEGRPITLRAVERWKAILDGARRHDNLITIEKAPFVVIQDLEIRWYRLVGIRVRESADVRVQGCRIWNAPPGGGTWPEGDGVRVERSPRFTGTGNVLFDQERGFELISSPEATITRNTAVANLYGGVVFVRSIEGSTCTNNSLAYQVNDAISIEEPEGGRERLAGFTCDYNNYGLTLQPGEAGEPPLEPRPKDRHLLTESKVLVFFSDSDGKAFRWFRTLQEWREFSGLDAHSIFADPLFVDSAAGDFHLESSSPNRGAGSDGTAIGALAD